MNRLAPALFTTLLPVVAALAQAPPEDPAATAAEPVRVHGMLLDDQYRPAADVPIALVLGDAVDVDAAIAAPLAKSAANGAFDVTVTPVADQDNALLIGDKRFALVRVRLAKGTTELDVGPITLARGFSAIGRVRSPDGQPLTEVRATITDLLDSRRFLRAGHYRKSWHCWTSAAAAPSGVFRLTGAVRSAGRLDIRCPGYVDVVIEPFAMGTPVDVTLERARVTRGKVVDADGVPLAAITVRGGRVSTKSAADGSFDLALCDRGATRLQAVDTERKGLQATSVGLPSADEPVELRMEPVDAAAKGLRVRAVDADGAELKDFEAYVGWTQQNQMSFQGTAILLAHAARDHDAHGRTDAGEVPLAGPRFDHQDTGIVFVHAKGHAWGQAEVSRPEKDEPLVVRLGAAVTVEGRIVDDSAGAPLAGVSIVPMPKLSDDVRRWLDFGHLSLADAATGPSAAVTDADGRFRLEDLPAGELDFVLCLDGAMVGEPKGLDLRDGKSPGPFEWKLPAPVTLQGAVKGDLPPGVGLRLHWHRENMSSSAWATEYDGALLLDASGAYTFENRPPRPYRPELLLPPEPRCGQRIKLYCPVWNDAAAARKDSELRMPAVATATGTVGGEVPWSRLAVVAHPVDENHFYVDFVPRGPLALVERDRTFRMRIEQKKVRLIVVDVLTGIPLEFRDLEENDLAQPSAWQATAVPFTLHLHDAVAGVARNCDLLYQPEEAHWPVPNQRFARFSQKSGVRFSARSGGDLPVWLPAKSGVLTVTVGDQSAEVDLARLPTAEVGITVGGDRIVVEK